MKRRELALSAFAGTAAMAIGLLGRPVLADAALGPVLAVVSHPVKDYAAWKVVYDSAEPVRQAAGVTAAEVFTDPADPQLVVVIHRFPSVEAANGFFGNPDLAAAMEKGGVTAKPSVILAVAA